MNHKAVSIRPFIGAKNFEISRNFYQDLGFQEVILGHNFSYFKTEGIGFYLQDAYVKDWIDNSMIFLEVDDVNRSSPKTFSLKFATNLHLLSTKLISWKKWRKC